LAFYVLRNENEKIFKIDFDIPSKKRSMTNHSVN